MQWQSWVVEKKTVSSIKEKNNYYLALSRKYLLTPGVKGIKERLLVRPDVELRSVTEKSLHAVCGSRSVLRASHA